LNLKTPNQLGYEDAGNRDIAMHRVQRAQLHNDQEQEDDHWPSGISKVLQALPLPPEAPGNKVAPGFRDQRSGISKQHILTPDL
jgi:hypothetical protein